MWTRYFWSSRTTTAILHCTDLAILIIQQSRLLCSKAERKLRPLPKKVLLWNSLSKELHGLSVFNAKFIAIFVFLSLKRQQTNVMESPMLWVLVLRVDHMQKLKYILSFCNNFVDWTPLHSACRWNAYNCVEILLAWGANINAVTHGGQTPLHLAAFCGKSRETLQVKIFHSFYAWILQS